MLPIVAAPQRTSAFLADLGLLRANPPVRQPALGNPDVWRLRDAFNAAEGSRRVIAIFSLT